MSLSDGFSLWAGKALFEITVVIGIIVLGVLGFFGWFICLGIRDKVRQWRSRSPTMKKSWKHLWLAVRSGRWVYQQLREGMNVTLESKQPPQTSSTAASIVVDVVFQKTWS
jgi:hypothetical protein